MDEGAPLPTAVDTPTPQLTAMDYQQGVAAVQRNAMIVALYEELEHLEQGLIVSASRSSSMVTTTNATKAGTLLENGTTKRSKSPPRPRRMRSRQPIRGIA